MIAFQDTSVSLTANETKFVLSLLGIVIAVFLRMAWAKAKSFGEIAERTRAIDQTLHGDPKAHEPNGLVRKLNHVATKIDEHATQFAEHVASDELWRKEARDLAHRRNSELQVSLTQIDNRLVGVEERLPAKLPERRRK